MLTSVQRMLSRDLADRLAEEDVSVEQWRVLRALSAADGISMSELAGRVQMPAPSLTRLVDSLVDHARAYRRPSLHDGRRVDVHLSATGADLLTRLEAIAAAHERTLAPDTVTAALRLLNQLAPHDENARS